MNKRIIAFVLFVLMMSAVFSAATEAEEQDLATPTDLSCLHEHVKTTIYFFDSPVYVSINSESHSVSGPAIVETVCTDCGEILSSEKVDNAEEIRPHSIKKGVCVLCGYREADRKEGSPPENDGGERTIIAPEDGSVQGLLTMTLSALEMSDLKEAGVSTVLVRGQKGSAAIVLIVEDTLTQMSAEAADLYMELAEQDTGSFFAGLHLISAAGDRIKPADGAVSLRFYQERKTGNRVSFAPADSDKLVETEGVWDERGFWFVPYLEEGTYFILQ